MKIPNFNKLPQTGTVEVQQAQNGFLIGNRIPQNYFVTKGTGESDIAVHAGSFHLALKSAGIEKANIMTYSSILPAIAQEIPKPQELIHGSVMESIMSVAHGSKNERISAGIIYGWLFDGEKKYGGLVCENQGHYSIEQLEELLQDSLYELYHNGFSHMTLKGIEIISDTFTPVKTYGTVLVSLCFTSYFYPVLSMPQA
jgi:arginine decarboxylase